MTDLADIKEAARRIERHCRRTELIHSHYFSAQLDRPLYFKCENLQRTGSFKIRGATHFLSQCDPALLQRGVITASAGNHAQGVALAARTRAISAIVVMPENTPLAKVLATRDYGGQVLLHGNNYDESAKKARELQKEKNLLYIPAFDHPHIIEGQGTVALEVLEQCPDAETLVIPIGGGGLIAGIATAARALKPRIRIVGVEAAQAPSALLSRRKGKRITLSGGRSLADGIVIKQLGERTYPIIESLVDEIVTVEEREIAQAMVSLMEKGKLVAEGAGAVSLAALLYGRRDLARGVTVCVISGGNLDVQTMSRVVERGMVAEGRYLKIRIELADEPGALAQLATLVGGEGANVFRVHHDRHKASLEPGRAEVDLELETRGPEHIETILGALRRNGYGARLRN